MLGAMYRAMTRTLVDAEKLLELLNEPTDINDKPGAPDLAVSDGEIEFGMCYNSLFPSVVDLVRYQTTSALRTMVVNLPCVVSLSASLREDLWPLSANLERGNQQSSVFFTDFMI